MNRKKFLLTSGFLGLGSIPVLNTLFAKYINPRRIINTIKEKIVFKYEGKRLNILGDHQTFKLIGKDTDNKVTFIYQDNPPNTQIPLHVHENEDELYNVITGEVEYTVNGKTTLLKSGDTIFLPRNIPHTWKVVGKTNATVNLNIFPSGLENMFEELNQLPAGPPDFPKVTEICGRYGIKFV